MRDNFRPNIRLITNILMVVGTFLIAINLASIGKQDKKYIQRRDDCADFISTKISKEQMIKAMGLKKEPSQFNRRLTAWCGIYGLRNMNI